MEISGRTGLCILIGDPVEHSVSPQIHNAAFRKLGLNYVYVAFAVKDVKSAVSGIRGLGIRGSSVTFPHKQNVLPLLDKLDPLAEKIGAVNTIVNDHGVLTGFNTDGEAAYLSLVENGIALKGKKISILGAGGASRAISFTLAGKRLGNEIVIFDVINERASSLAREVSAKTGARVRGAKFDRKAMSGELADSEVLINTSPVGVYPRVNESPIPRELVPKGICVFDIVYNPAQTLLMKYARNKGCRTIPGIEMLVRQAGEQFRLWTGEKPPLNVMFRAGKQGILGVRPKSRIRGVRP